MRIILTASAFFFITFFGIGQSNKIDIQVEGGPSLISVNRVFFDDKPTLNGFTGGFFSTYNLNKRFSIKSGLSYERKGFLDKYVYTKPNGQNLLGFNETLYTLDYLIVPILIRFNFGNKVRFSINGGPYLAYLAQQNYGINPYFINNQLIKKSFDLGVSAGIGCSYPLNDLLSVSVEARNNSSTFYKTAVGYFNTNSTNFIFGITYHLKDSK